MTDGPLIYIAAGEASGDALGARLMAALKRRTGGSVRFAGIGGEQMGEEGLVSLFPMQELSVMGLVEVLPHIRRIRRRIAEAAADVDAKRPDVIVTVDAPGFARRFVDKVANRSIPRVHYVAPTVWAWRPKRVHGFKARYDRVLALLPFEPPYFAAVGLDCRFVGHPVLEGGAGTGDGPAFRARHAIAPDAPLLCVLPGSRRGEVVRLAGDFGAALDRLAARHPDLRVVVPTVAALTDMVADAVAAWPGAPVLTQGRADKFDAMAASNAALAASGTVTLELALSGVPTVLAYRFPAVTHAIAKRLVKVRHAHMVNIMAEEEIVPEFVQHACTPDALAQACESVLDPARGQAQIARARPYLDRLRPPTGTPSDAAADAVLEMIGA